MRMRNEYLATRPMDLYAMHLFELLATFGYTFYAPDFAPSMRQPLCRPSSIADEVPFQVWGELKLTPVNASTRYLCGERINVLATPIPL